MTGAAEAEAATQRRTDRSGAQPEHWGIVERLLTFLRQFWDILAGRRLLLGLSVGSGLVYAAANLIPPILIRELIRWLTEGGGGRQNLIWLTAALLAVYLLRGLSRYGYGRFSHLAAYMVMHDLMVRVYRHVQSLPHRFFTGERTGNLISRSVNDIEAVEDFVAHGVPETTLAVVIPAAMITVLAQIDAQLTAITLAPIPVVAFLIYRFSSNVRRRWRQVRSSLSDLVAQVQDNFSGISVIKAFVRERESARRVEHRSAAFRDASIAANHISLMPSGLMEAAGGIGIVLVIGAGGASAFAGRISVADLFLFIVYLGYIYQPFLQLASMSDQLSRAAVSTDRVFQLLAIEPDIVDAPGALSPPEETMSWTLRFDHVTFAYSDDAEPVLHGVDFEIPESSVVALVGHTGAGKTTVSQLLPRFYDPQAGAVYLGGFDLRELRIDYLRRHIASVHQDVFLFHGSVRDNILFGRPEASDDELRGAARAANAEEFILDLPQGYDTAIGERGVRLSGGQKQRLSIARALLKDAPVLVLDEATSSVDTHTEMLIQQALERLIRHRTTLVIAHRLSTVRGADSIIVLERGRVVEIGRHQELLERGGAYTRMIDAQDLTAGGLLRGNIA